MKAASFLLALGVATALEPLFSPPSSHFEDGSVADLDEEAFLKVGSHGKKDDLYIIKFYLLQCSACMERVPMWRAVGDLFSEVPGVKIAAVNCDEKDEDGINKACTNCVECFPDYPVQNIESFPTVRSFHNGKKEEAGWEETLTKTDTAVHMVDWILDTHKDKFDDATAASIREKAKTVKINNKELFGDDDDEDEDEDDGKKEL